VTRKRTTMKIISMLDEGTDGFCVEQVSGNDRSGGSRSWRRGGAETPPQNTTHSQKISSFPCDDVLFGETSVPEDVLPGDRIVPGTLIRSRPQDAMSSRLGGQGSAETPFPKHQKDDLRQITPLTIDGGTTISARGIDSRLFSRELRSLWERVEAGVSSAVESRRRRTGHCWYLEMAFPWWKLETNGGNRKRLYVDAHTEGRRHQRLVVHADGIFYMVIDKEAGRASVQFKAPELWSQGAGVSGFRRVSSWLVPELDKLLFGERKNEDHDFDSLCESRKWRVRSVEVCSDWRGLEMRKSDGNLFCGGVKGRQTGKFDSVKVRGRSGERAETLELGSRSSRRSLCIYDKPQQLIDVKGGDLSTYLPAWREGGLDATSIKDIPKDLYRVEMRLRDEGLVIEESYVRMIDRLKTEMSRLQDKGLHWLGSIDRLRKGQQEEDVRGDSDAVLRTLRMITNRERLVEGNDIKIKEKRIAIRKLEERQNSSEERSIDLTDIRSLFDPEKLAKVWSVTTRKIRLVEGDNKRLERCTTDPRWVAVQGAGGTLENFNPEEWRQQRSVQKGAIKTILERASSSSLKSTIRAMALLYEKPLLPYVIDSETGEIMFDSKKQSPVLDKEKARVMLYTLLAEGVEVLARNLGDDEVCEMLEYSVNYRNGHEAMLGPEMQELREHARSPYAPPKWVKEKKNYPMLPSGFLDQWDVLPEIHAA